MTTDILSAAEVRETLSAHLGRHDAMCTIRATADQPAVTPLDAEQWRELATATGVAALGIPAEYDGLGAGIELVAASCEVAGAMLYPGPLVANSIATQALVLALASCAHDQSPAVAKWLPKIANGELITTVALPAQGPLPKNPPVWNGSALNGTSPVVRHGDEADLVLVLAADQEGVPVVIALTEPGSARRLSGVDLACSCATLEHQDEPGLLIGRGTEFQDALLGYAHLLLAAEHVGAAREALNRTVEHLKVREQFDTVIGSYQALQHRCADLLLKVESAAALVEHSAEHLNHSAQNISGGDPNAHPHSSAQRHILARCLLTRARASQALLDAGSTVVQLHGGMGFTWEHDAHLYFRRSRASGSWFGTPDQLYRAAAEQGCLDLLGSGLTP